MSPRMEAKGVRRVHASLGCEGKAQRAAQPLGWQRNDAECRWMSLGGIATARAIIRELLWLAHQSVLLAKLGHSHHPLHVKRVRRAVARFNSDEQASP